MRKAAVLVQNAAVTPMRYVYPLDPECPVVAEFMETLFGDPTTMAIGAPVEDITEEFERRHRKQCGDNLSATFAAGCRARSA